jgi:hypothetical protein
VGAKRKPGPLSASSDQSNDWTPVALGWMRTQADRASESVKAVAERVSATGKSTLLGILDLLPLKPDSPFSTKLLRHYVEGSGEAYELGEIPEQWQDWIVKATKAKVGRHQDLSPYNSGIYDLRNSLGHFTVTVSQPKNSKSKLYQIEDIYAFGFIRNDRDQRGRHGFPLGQLSETTTHTIQFLLPHTEHRNPGGFSEKWEIRKAGKETTLFIPQDVLAQQGKPFRVHGKFQR